MKELIPRPKGAPGRVRTVTASAWIARRNKGGNYHSHVYVGAGRVHVLSTHTAERGRALEFNRCHLMQALRSNSSSSVASVDAPSQGVLLPFSEMVVPANAQERLSPRTAENETPMKKFDLSTERCLQLADMEVNHDVGAIAPELLMSDLSNVKKSIRGRN